VSSRRKRDNGDDKADDKPAVDTSAQDVQYTGEDAGPKSVQEAADRAAEERQRRIDAGELRAGTEGGVPDPSIQPGTGTVTDPVPGAPSTPAGTPGEQK
jgi:hypothetical protein